MNFSIQETLTVIAKGVRNITISFQRFYNQYIKYAGNVGQDIVESIFSFVQYKPIPVTELVQMHFMRLTPNQDGDFRVARMGRIYLLFYTTLF